MYNIWVVGTTPNTLSSVFISYAHESDGHKASVLALAQRLRRDGVPCVIDQDVESPPEGWPAWMLRHIADSPYVLVVCSPLYRRRFEGREKRGVGKGAKWE